MIGWDWGTEFCVVGLEPMVIIATKAGDHRAPAGQLLGLDAVDWASASPGHCAGELAGSALLIIDRRCRPVGLPGQRQQPIPANAQPSPDNAGKSSALLIPDIISGIFHLPPSPRSAP